MPKTKNKISLEERYLDISDQTASLRPVPRQKASPAPRILRAIENGEDIIATREFTGARVNYKRGDVVACASWPQDRLMVYADEGYVMSASEFETLEKYNARFNKLEREIKPAYDQYQRAIQAHSRSMSPIIALENQLEDARTVSSEMLERVKVAEKELSDLVNSDEIIELFD